jgi:3-hydroxyisobutyrate dehydrogenase
MGKQSMTKKIGLIGVGRMGFAMAQNLIAAGYSVTGYRRSAMDAFVTAGGIAAASPAEVVAASDLVFTCLPDNNAVRHALERSDGILQALKPGQIVVETTSLPPEDKRAHAGAIAGAGGVMLDCPVSGTPGMLKAGRGAFFVSGDRATANSINDVLETICPRATWVGDIGAGAATKSVATALVAIHNLAAAEGLAIAAREGGDIAAVYDAISGSPASSAMFEMRGALMAKRDYSSGGGSLEGYLRGLSRVHDTSGPQGATPLLDVTRAWYEAAVDAGHTGQDQACVFEHLINSK